MHAVLRRCSYFGMRIALAVCKTLAITKALPQLAGILAARCSQMEEVFVVHYDRSNCRDDPCDPFPDSFDTEVIGVFLQRCYANECARDKVDELLHPGSEYLAEDGYHESDTLDFSWEGTRRDERNVTDRVYVSKHAIEDPSPTKKRARTATDAGDMTFEAAEPFLAAMKQGDLVAAIGRAWDASPALRSQLDAATADTWSRAPNQMLMLAYNWEEDPNATYGDRSFVRFKDAAAEVNIGNLWRGMSMAGVKDLLDGGDLVWEDEDGEEGGCEECGAPGSTCTVILEVNRQGTLRLVAETQIMCYCNSDSAEVACTDRATFRIAAPARKTKRKAR